MQCPYLIKDAKGIGWWNCQLEAGHEATTPHKAPRPNGRDPEVEGIWHIPGEKETPQILSRYCVCDEVRRFIAKKITTDRWWTCEVHGSQHFDPDAQPTASVLSVWEKK
jgi:hypothetical protein